MKSRIPESTPVSRVELRRVKVAEVVTADDALWGARLFRGLKKDLLTLLLDSATPRRFAHKATIFEVGDRGDSLFMVLKGEARISTHSGTEPVEIAAVRKGDFFGEDAALSGQGRGCAARAHGELDLAEFPRQKVLELGQGHPLLLQELRSVYQQRKVAQEELSSFLSRW